MGVALLIGCVLLAYSVPAAVFFILLFRRAQLVVVMLSSAFFWLLAMTLSSLIWAAIPPLHDSTDGWAIVPVSVIAQELMRGLFIRFYFKAERSFSVVSINAIVFPLIDLYSAIAAGVGFGALQSFFYYGVIIGHASGPGALFSPTCDAFSTFFAAAWNALFFNILHIALMILAFDAYRTLNIIKISIFIILHAAAAAFTILNNIDGGCVMSLPLVAATVVVAVAWAIFITHHDDYRSNKGRRVHNA